jgi:TadE-like protein
MRDLKDKFLSLLVRDTNASEIAEAAFVLPLMFTMLLGIFWFGQAFTIYGAITRAAQEGARAGAAPQCSTCSSTQTNTQYATAAANAVNAALIASKLDPSLIQTPSPPNINPCGDNVQKLNCGSTGAACVQLPVQLQLPPTPQGGDCGVSVYFQYPFKSWLPFTSLNQQLLMLTASAEVRIETR